MAGHWTDTFSFIRGVVYQRSFAYVALSSDELAQAKRPHWYLTSWTAGTWGGSGTRFDWLVAGLAMCRMPIVQLVAVGEYGQVFAAGKGGLQEELIRSADSSPGERGPLRGVRAIDGKAYAVGMDRQAYRRDAINQWTLLDNGVGPDVHNAVDAESDVVGFEAVDGFSAAEIYAVGWDGEVWSFDGHRWEQRDSPTNVTLTDVCCAGDGQVYACGQRGMLLRGRGAQWQILDQEVTDDFWSLAWFNGSVYSATMSGLFRLEDTVASEVDFGDDTPDTCFNLTASDGVMWSIGAKDVMAFDGREWTRID